MANATITRTQCSFTIPNVKTGTYTGNGSASPGTIITGLGFAPDFVLIMKISTNTFLVAIKQGTNPTRLADSGEGDHGVGHRVALSAQIRPPRARERDPRGQAGAEVSSASACSSPPIFPLSAA